MAKDFYTTLLLLRFFFEAYNASNFMYVWLYMNGYLDVEKSSSLKMYYCKGTPIALYFIEL